ncbi:MAG: hypothetical protein HKO81_03280 [Flavobacteriaceae bacterium]|nr:hypothetical protein [Bacteroidia bacterium]MBT8268375.1 hypothetical protein [Bacteroidia bacterium]NNL15647.1 hypothetical protein [Flavobacteriaceae bacterium]NNL80290.1 hypothetical protein [Flavobacteriaceae bacterium]
MLLAIIIYTFKKFYKKVYSLPRKQVTRWIVFIVLIVVPLLLASNETKSGFRDTEFHMYDVFKADKKIGYIQIEKQISGKNITYYINSEIKTKLIFNFNAISKERVRFKRDTLTESSIFRKLNNKVRINEKLEYKDGGYYLVKDNKEKLITQEVIKWNLIRLYFEEPNRINKVYCDRYKKYQNLTHLGDGKYKVIFPNRSSNIFHYQAGRCVQVDAIGSFYQVKLVKRNTDLVSR